MINDQTVTQADYDPEFIEAWIAQEDAGFIYSESNIAKVYLGWQMARHRTAHSGEGRSNGAGEGLAEQFERIGDEYADGKRIHSDKISASVIAASCFYQAAELVKRHTSESNFAVLVEGLHAQIFGVHSLGDPALSHAALADGGQIHEAAHALIRALPAPQGEGRSNGAGEDVPGVNCPDCGGRIATACPHCGAEPVDDGLAALSTPQGEVERLREALERIATARVTGWGAEGAVKSFEAVKSFARAVLAQPEAGGE